MSEIKLKRAYEPPDQDDGLRILVDRLWPRGKTKEALELYSWAKAIAPSKELRKVFSHMVTRFQEFSAAYQVELDANPASIAFIDEIKQALRASNVTLVFAAKDETHNQAQVLKAWLEQKLKTK